jgi:hypothetical protein
VSCPDGCRQGYFGGQLIRNVRPNLLEPLKDIDGVSAGTVATGVCWPRGSAICEEFGERQSESKYGGRDSICKHLTSSLAAHLNSLRLRPDPRKRGFKQYFASDQCLLNRISSFPFAELLDFQNPKDLRLVFRPIRYESLWIVRDIAQGLQLPEQDGIRF